jgi:hypothetical protein
MKHHYQNRIKLRPLLAVALVISVFAACGGNPSKIKFLNERNNKSTSVEHAKPLTGSEEDADAEREVAFDLTSAQCSVAANIAKVTASPSGTLFINSTLVTNDNRAKVVAGVPGKWSFAYAMREILELPNPSTTPALLAAEQAAVTSFLDKYIQTAPVNTFVPPSRAGTRSQLLAAWGKTTGSDAKLYLTFDKAPFKLLAIVNRLDIVKKGKTAVTAGEGRFVYGFTGGGPMTVILEYDLPIAAASNRGMINILAWVRKWQNLKTFLTDTNTAVTGTQPNQAVGAALSFRDKPGYLAALEQVTEMWANRAAQKRTGGTQAAISQIRTNEILSSPWELREIVRNRTAAGKAALGLTTVKNNPASSFINGGNGLTAWINANVTCSVATNKNSCSYITADGMLPATIPNGAATVRLLNASSPEDVTWFSGSTVVKQRFVALNTCSGCHTGETGTAFVHVDPSNAAPSQFLKIDLARRLKSFKNLVCLDAAALVNLNLAEAEEDTSSLRIDTSNFTH